ncbi:MAG: Maf family nucleotide pyrophosphatase [Gammaproteobacteria bacterium]|nr:Maf family nucleotide pyrophosphatase [Gammaproteobacteria bacterium]
MKLVLGSSSPYRRELLSRLHLPFEAYSPDIDEARLPEESPTALVRRLAEQKARAVASRFPNHLIIGSDQVAAVGDTIITKPNNAAHAVEQLQFLSGKTVLFHTGLCLLNAQTSHLQLDNIVFEVGFRVLDDASIQRYLAKEPAYNCVGAFKSEAYGIALTTHMRGDDPTALIGLPLICLTEMLRAEGISIP